MARRTKIRGVEQWRLGEEDDGAGVDVYPQEPSKRRSRCDEVCAWRGRGYSGAALSCTLREWADWTEKGAHVRGLVRDTLGDEAADQVDDAVKGLLPRPKSYHVGWDTIMPDPGEVESWDCRVCGAACDVRRGVVGRTSSISPHERAHDSFTCPNAGSPWHDQALKLRQAIEDMPSPSVRALMEGDLANLLKEGG